MNFHPDHAGSAGIPYRRSGRIRRSATTSSWRHLNYMKTSCPAVLLHRASADSDWVPQDLRELRSAFSLAVDYPLTCDYYPPRWCRAWRQITNGWDCLIASESLGFNLTMNEVEISAWLVGTLFFRNDCGNTDTGCSAVSTVRSCWCSLHGTYDCTKGGRLGVWTNWKDILSRCDRYASRRFLELLAIVFLSVPFQLGHRLD